MEELARFGRASLAQVAELMGRSEEQVAEAAVRLEGDGAVVRGMLAASAVTALISEVEPARPLQDAEALLRNAFRLARENAKADWASMAVPVLKNRLLQLTDGTFREKDFGAPSIWHFVTLFPGLVACEGVRPSERVRLREPELIETDDRDESAELDPVGKGRIRDDLWRAVFDYRSGKTYAWDETRGRASDHADPDSAGIRVPTITAAELRTLRQEFVRTQETVSEHDAARLAEWVDGAGATAALPRFYRPLWNAHLKSHAADRLRTFFIQAGLDVPSDLIAHASPPTAPVSDVEHARRRAHAYIDAMTGEELGRLSIELSVIARVRISDEG
ncbi:hypothetical protein [Curtobacterium sp. MCBD17_032]|uniref:hypothetical protein n=1 Tax=Curtobacterium sp. MCBD17_032 TaxID=2175659 RepID=UPI000DAF6A76|nr:hypothetical protein [Curtobacterium sp. MCBD17_032]PZE86849.1 hypothetical protein DEI91_00645 [Curtobacterium sp. MCBD17_032]